MPKIELLFLVDDDPDDQHVFAEALSEIDTDVNLDAMQTIVRVNGREDLRFKTNDMIFDIPTYIEAMTRYLTLYPGDVIWMGTDGTSPNLVHGDVVEVELTGLGVLRNRFVREE